MYLRQFIFIFAFLYILFIPVQFNFFPFQENITNSIFGTLIEFAATLVGIELKNPNVSSDSGSTYILLGILVVLSIIIVIILKNTLPGNLHKNNFLNYLRLIFIWYLSLQLFKYGFDKVFKYQFYLPEPNILYTPVGHLTKDFLYWTSMGTSYWYSVFAGLIEIIPACFLLFKKTRVLGLLISSLVLLNVLAINIGFDISVKIHSAFLLLLTLILLQPQFKQLYCFFILNRNTALDNSTELNIQFRNPSIAPTLKTLLLCLILMESLFPYATARNFNDDLATRPYLHGAYDINEIIPLSNDSLPRISLKRLFIHRSGYIIFQNNKDQMKDLKLSIDSVKKEFTLTDYHQNKQLVKYNYTSVDSMLQVHYFVGKNEYLLKTKALNWRQLPALQKSFHWTVDGYE